MYLCMCVCVASMRAYMHCNVSMRCVHVHHALYVCDVKYAYIYICKQYMLCMHALYVCMCVACAHACMDVMHACMPVCMSCIQLMYVSMHVWAYACV